MAALMTYVIPSLLPCLNSPVDLSLEPMLKCCLATCPCGRRMAREHGLKTNVAIVKLSIRPWGVKCDEGGSIDTKSCSRRSDVVEYWDGDFVD